MGGARIVRWLCWTILVAMPLPAVAACVGDCNRDGAVTIDELLRGVRVLLTDPAADDTAALCSLDRDANGELTTDELIAAVRRALDGCPRAMARRITDPSDLIGGPMAVGRVGDFLLANDRLRVVIGEPGRHFSLLLTYGGNILDADLARAPGEPGGDQFGGMTPRIQLGSTVDVQQVEVVDDGSDGGAAVIRTAGVDDLLDAINDWKTR